MAEDIESGQLKAIDDTLWIDFDEDDNEEVSAELFIKTNGTCATDKKF